MRHLGWLHATPDGSKKSRLKSYLELDENSLHLKLPDIENAGYLVELLNEAGLLQSNGMGIMPISWQEIESWITCTSLELTLWEILTIKGMSEAYVGEYNAASAKDRAAPYTHVEPEEVIDRPAVASRLKMALRSLMRQPQDDTSLEVDESNA